MCVCELGSSTKAELANLVEQQQQQLPLMRGPLPACLKVWVHDNACFCPSLPSAHANSIPSWWVPSVAYGSRALCCCWCCCCCCCWHRVIAPWGALWERRRKNKYKLLLYPHFSVTRRDIRFLRQQEHCVCVGFCVRVCVCTVGDWYLWRKWFIYWWLSRAREVEPDDPNWAKWPTHDNLIIKQAAAPAPAPAKVRGRKTEKKRERVQSLHWFALKCICSSLLAFFNCCWQLNVKFCPCSHMWPKMALKMAAISVCSQPAAATAPTERKAYIT